MPKGMAADSSHCTSIGHTLGQCPSVASATCSIVNALTPTVTIELFLNGHFIPHLIVIYCSLYISSTHFQCLSNRCLRNQTDSHCLNTYMSQTENPYKFRRFEITTYSFYNA
ncbi:hypothetical protein BsWGS_06012 [Bradybaena similaris]